MHTLRHDDPANRVELDGTWRFQLLRAPDTEPATDWAEAASPGLLDHGRASTISPLHERPDAVPGLPAGHPGRQPDRRLRARDRGTGRLAPASRIVLHVERGGERPDRVDRRRATSGIGEDSHLAAEFDVTDALAEPARTG